MRASVRYCGQTIMKSPSLRASARDCGQLLLVLNWGIWSLGASISDAQVVRTPIIFFFVYVLLQDACVVKLLLVGEISIGRNCGLGWTLNHLLQVFRGLAAAECKRRLSPQHGGDMLPRICTPLDVAHVIVAEDDIAFGLVITPQLWWIPR